MRNLAKLLFRRVVIVSISILLQIAMIIALGLWLSAYRRWIDIVLVTAQWVLVISIVTGHANSSYKIAWILLIFFFPIAGLAIYSFFGGSRLSRREQARMRTISQFTEESLTQDFESSERLRADNEHMANLSSYLLRCAVNPVYTDTQTEYFDCGERCYEKMLAALRVAEHAIYLEYFIIEPGRMWNGILDILREKAAAGVDVRLIYDDFGCITRLPIGYFRKLESMGIRTKVFNPFLPILSGRLNNRDHRKLLVIDNTVGFTGGVNLADEYINEKTLFGHWKDCGILLRGGAVRSMTVMFLSMWNYISGDASMLPPACGAVGCPKTLGYVQPFSDSPLDHEAVGESLILQIIQLAVHSVYIMTPYLVIGDKVLSALCIAAKSGVDVRIITPGVPDKRTIHMLTRSYYKVLMDAGVRIYEYTPGFIHSKVICADGEISVVGTVNLDFRSLYLHFEDGVFLYRAACQAAINADFEQSFPVCREITPQDCNCMRHHQRMICGLLRIFSPLV